MYSQLVKYGSLFSVAFLPGLASAQILDASTPTDAAGLVNDILAIINPFTLLIVAVAGLVFMYALIKYLTSAGDEKSRGEAKGLMLWGIIILVVMVSVWGIVNFLSNTLVGDKDLAKDDVPNITY